MFKALSSIARLFRIGRTLANHDALFFLERLHAPAPVIKFANAVSRKNVSGRPGERLSAALQELGPTFIKLGQALSVRSDLVGEDVAGDLSALQDNLPPFDSAAARAIVEEELAAPLSEYFSEFDETPVAAASIAQVHFAVTTDGDDVAVKVLRPGVDARFQQDIDLMLWLARIAQHWIPSTRRLRPVEVVRTFESTVNTEMDLRLEAAAASELKDNFEGDSEFSVPKVDWVRTGRRVMTLARINGIRIDDIAGLRAAGFDPKDVLARSANAFFKQVFRDGFFHADMHPGNMFVASDGTLCPVDFGIMGRLDQRTRNYLADMLLGFLERDYRRVAEVHFEAGYVPRRKSMDDFTQTVRSIGEPILGRPLHEISLARLLAHLFQVTARFEMQTQPQLLLLQKTMLVAEGVGRKLDPTVNMWMLAQPLIEEWMREHRGPEARVRAAVGETLSQIERLPGLVNRAEAVVEALSDGAPLPPDRPAAQRRSPNWLLYIIILAVLIWAVKSA